MTQKAGPYHLVDLPAARRDTPNFIDIIWWKHWIYGLLEVDVTSARKSIAEYESRTKEELSFTGYLIYCLARAVDEDKSVQAYLKGRKKLVVFDDVDVLMTVERKIGEIRAPIGHVIRQANHKTYMEINDEIRSVQTMAVPASKGIPPIIRHLMLLPDPLPKLFIALVRMYKKHNPVGMAAMGGTVGVTAVGMFGRSSGWGLTPLGHSLDLVVGGISWKPAVVDGRIEPREILNLTVVFDHDVIDGSPAARFVQRLVELIESGSGLPEPAQAIRAEISIPV